MVEFYERGVVDEIDDGVCIFYDFRVDVCMLCVGLCCVLMGLVIYDFDGFSDLLVFEFVEGCVIFWLIWLVVCG